MPQYHGVTMMKSCGAASAASCFASKSTLVKRRFKFRWLKGIAISAVAATSVKNASRQYRCSDGNGSPRSKHTAINAMGGKKYHGSVGTAANQRKPVNPATVANNVAPAKSGKSSCKISFVAALDFLSRAKKAAQPDPMTASVRNPQTQVYAGFGNAVRAEKLWSAMTGENPVRSEMADCGSPEIIFQYGSNEIAATSAAQRIFTAAENFFCRQQTVHAPKQMAAKSTAFW